MFNAKIALASIVALSAMTAVSSADVINLLPEESGTLIPDWKSTDAMVYSGYYYSFAPTENFLRYDLSSIAPAPGMKLVINSATITVNYSASAVGDPFNQNLYFVSDDTWAITGDSMLWGDRPAHDSTVLATDITPAAWAVGTLFSSTQALTDLVAQQGDGDGKLSLMFIAAEDLGDPGAASSSQRHREYYPVGDERAPRLDIDYSYAPVPEPMSAGLLSVGLLMLAGVRRRRA